MSALQSFLSALGKAATVLCCVALAMTACSRTAPPSASHSPPATPGSSSPPAAPVPGLDADSLLVSVEDARRIANDYGLQQAAQGVSQRPKHFDSDAPPPCQAANDQEATFGAGWQQFRSKAYTADMPGPSVVVGGRQYPGATKMLDVIQNISIYPQSAAARAALERLVPTLKACSELHVRYYDYTVTMPDPSTVVLTYPDSETSSMYRVKSAVFMQVSVLGFRNSEEITQTMIQTITGRITR
ncbi:sensor domain-containing protein [Mycobacterium avium subsp. hominissuis]|uniref:sensor domain-containing protein n=1 Tax=Mycobacterium avium TaxID=1764 RepID=UPI00293A331C|nr:sensor domain-containing protein [Mycobacterium avium]MDV3306327.1 sensor domain-containing protein [Mycobacterium avium subsp. hominissuis]